MPIFQPGPGAKCCVTFIFFALLVLPLAPALAEETPGEWQPSAPMPDKFDWIQLTSDEWLKGEFVAMYNHELEFDSDELDLLTFDWEDVKQVRTARIMQVRFLGNIDVRGKLFIEGDTVRLIGDQEQEFQRSHIVTITAGALKEINHWSGKVTLGMSVREGNVDQIETNAKANFKRRTVKNRLIMDYLANYNVSNDEELANNHRASLNLDRFITDRFFMTPLGLEYFRDPFQNIASRSTIYVGAGFQLIDTGKTDWQVSGGPAYQETRFNSVAAGEDDFESTAALSFGTVFDTALTRAVDFIFEYRLQLTSEEAGSYNHHMLISFETEWTKHLDFDITLVWDRTQDPRPEEDMTVPEQDDVRMVLGLGLDF